MIIETHGMQHYEKFDNSYFVLEEEQKNDKIKRELAVNNGIDYYIEMDCRYSDLSWLMDNTIKSLSGLFDLSSSDFSEIYKKAVKHHIVSIMELLNDGKTVPEISKTIGLAKNTIYRRIKTMRDLDVYNLPKYNIREVR
jgi:DNA-binding NarL/FixJ family response regulator